MISSDDYKTKGDPNLKDVNFVRAATDTMAKTSMEAKKHTNFKLAMLKLKRKEVQESTKIHCRQCKTKDKKHFVISVHAPTLEKKDVRFTCHCTNCGFGGRRDKGTGKREIWNITKKQ